MCPSLLLLLLLLLNISPLNALISWGKPQNYCTEARLSIRMLLSETWFISILTKTVWRVFTVHWLLGKWDGVHLHNSLDLFWAFPNWEHKSRHHKPWLLFNRQTPYTLRTEHKGADDIILSNCFLCDTDRLQQKSNTTPVKTVPNLKKLLISYFLSRKCSTFHLSLLPSILGGFRLDKF